MLLQLDGLERSLMRWHLKLRHIFLYNLSFINVVLRLTLPQGKFEMVFLDRILICTAPSKQSSFSLPVFPPSLSTLPALPVYVWSSPFSPLSPSFPLGVCLPSFYLSHSAGLLLALCKVFLNFSFMSSWPAGAT